MQFVEINNRITHFRFLQNEGKPVIAFINSLGTDFRIWEDVVEELRDQYAILLFDKAGHGLSEIPTNDWSMQNYVDDFTGLIDHLGILKITLVGLSIGGMISMLFASQNNDRLERMMLCDTAPKIGREKDWNTRIKTIDLKGIPFLSSAILERWFAKGFSTNNKEALRGYQLMLEKTSVKGYNYACQAIRDADLSDLFSKITIPVLCLCGGEDLSTPPELVKLMASQFKTTDYVEIEKTGHLPCVEKPDVFVDHLLKFMRGKTLYN